MMTSLELSLVPNEGAKSEIVAASAVSAQSTALYAGRAGYVNIYCANAYFFRMGVNPTALATGVDQYVPAGNLVRVGPIPPTFKLAFILLSGTASVYITKES